MSGIIRLLTDESRRPDLFEVIGLLHLISLDGSAVVKINELWAKLKNGAEATLVRETEDRFNQFRRILESVSDESHRLFEDRNGVRGKIYADGVFDLMHFGHHNAIRQASELGHWLAVGVVSDAEAAAVKGAFPIYPHAERFALVKACRWVDKAIPNAPYDVSMSYLKSTGCEFVCHGDDLAPNADGKDCYEEARASGKLKIFKRTRGVSTTSLMHRVMKRFKLNQADQLEIQDTAHEICDESVTLSPEISVTSTERLREFIGPDRAPVSHPNVVYVQGVFDFFHVGHLRFLEQVKRKYGGYLVVGIYDDATVRSLRGWSPVMGLMERALSVLAMRVVDDALLGVPIEITDNMIRHYHVVRVVCGLETIESLGGDLDLDHAYTVPRDMGKLQILECDELLKTSEVLCRVLRMCVSENVERRLDKERRFWNS